MKFTQESIELAFKELGIEYPIDSFIIELTKIRKMETKNRPKKNIIVHYVFPPMDEIDVPDFIKTTMSNGFDFDNSDIDVPDSGIDLDFYLKIGDRYYQVTIHFEAEWISDWSVRKNVAVNPEVINILELTNIKVMDNHGDVIQIL